MSIKMNNFNHVIIDLLKNNRVVRPVLRTEWGNEERWKRLLKGNDQKKIWKSINWAGSIEENTTRTPSDEEFKLHFESLLNPELIDNNENAIDTTDSPFIPILDEPITDIEVIEADKSFKESKSFIGITPAIFKCLPLVWISFVTQMLNLIFCNNQLSFRLNGVTINL